MHSASGGALTIAQDVCRRRPPSHSFSRAAPSPVSLPRLMQIGSDKVVSIEYTLKDDKGEVLDSSTGGEPLAYLHGRGNLISGLERALEGKSVGDKIEVTLTPEDGYGVRDEALIRKLPLRKLGAKKVQVGGRYRAQTEEGIQVVLVKSVQGDYATVDGNHPLAGMTLHFAVTIAAVRESTEEEREHGHVHEPGGHHH